MNAGVVMWARSEWRRRWGALALLAMLIALGGGAAVAAAGAAKRTDTAFDRMRRVTREPNLFISALGETEIRDLDPALLDRVMAVEGVLGVTEEAFVAASPAEYPTFFSLAAFEERAEALRPIYVEGPARDHMSDMAVDEILINEAMRDVLGKGVGDTIQIQTATTQQFLAALTEDTPLGEPQGPTITVHIVGVARTVEEISDAPDPFLTFSRAFYETYHDAIWSCRCVVAVNAEPDALVAVAAELAAIYPDAIIEPNEDFGARLSDTVELQQRAWDLMALTAAVAGTMTLLLACSRFVRLLTISDANHRALGMTRRERHSGRFLIMVPSVLIGAAGGAGFAYALSPLAPVGITRRAEPDPGLHWDWAVGTIGIGAILACSLLVTGMCSVVVRRGSDRVHFRLRRGGPVLSLGGRMTLGPGRSAIVGVFIATLGTAGALTVDHSINHALTTPSLYGADFDAEVLDTVGHNETTVSDELAADPDIAAAALMWIMAGNGNDTPVHIVGPGGVADLQPSALQSVKGVINPIVTKGRAPLLANEAAIGRDTMDELGVRVGEPITVTGLNGLVQLTVVGDLVNPGVDTTGGGFAVTLDGLAALGEPAIAGTVVRFITGADSAAVIDRHPELDLVPVVPPSEVGNIGELGGLPDRVAQLLVLLGLAALLNAIVITVGQGRRQIAVHRALGFTNAQVIGAHLWQSAAAVAIGGTLGGFAGFVLGRAIHHQLVSDVGAIAETVIPGAIWSAAVAALAVMIVVGVTTSALALRRRPGVVLRAE